MPTLSTNLTRDAAFELLSAYNSDAFHITHGETLEGIMRYFAQKVDPDNVEFWGQVGLLHDLDWEKFPTEHTVAAQRILTEAGATPELIHAIQTHTWREDGESCVPGYDFPEPSCTMERYLFAMDELSGLVGACVAMRPSHSVMDFNVKSLKKKFKQRSFAAGCDRDVISQGAQMLGLTNDELFAQCIEAEQSFAPDRDTFSTGEADNV